MSDVENLRQALRERTAELALEAAARRRAEESLIRSQHLEHIGRLTAGIAHDLNNLLFVACVHADALASGVGDAGQQAAEAVQLQGVLARAVTLTARVMAVARGDDSLLRDVHLAGLLHDVAPVIYRLVGSNIAVTVESEPALWQVRGDASQLEQVLLNLCANARDAMPSGGTLTVRARNRTLPGGALRREFDLPPGDYVELTAEDTGIGITEEVRRRLFEPFFTTKAPGRGTGLGLASSLAIARRLGGTIEVESEVGVGSVFRVLLPRVQATAVPSLGGGTVPASASDADA